MNLPVVLGRTFLPGEENAVIVSESAARAVWPNQDPVGKIWNLAGAARTVMGVVEDSGANLLAEADSIEAYVPIEGLDVERSALILRTRGDPASLVHMIPAAAAAGMFALVAFVVAQRKRELGIRIAIGAAPHHIL